MNEFKCEQYWWENPAILIAGPRKTLCPIAGCKSDAINALTRTFVIVLIVGIIAFIYEGGVLSFMIAGITATVLSLPVVMSLIRGDEPPPEVVKEGFEDAVASPAPVTIIGKGTAKPWTEPTASNPFMNVLVDEYGSSPDRRPAMSADDPVAKQSLNDFFRTQWFSDPTDVFGRNQGQRQFVTMPSTSIPNDRESYQNWLYKIPGKSCKEGGRHACLPGTDGSAVTWLNFDA